MYESVLASVSPSLKFDCNHFFLLIRYFSKNKIAMKLIAISLIYRLCKNIRYETEIFVDFSKLIIPIY